MKIRDIVIIKTRYSARLKNVGPGTGLEQFGEVMPIAIRGKNYAVVLGLEMKIITRILLGALAGAENYRENQMGMIGSIKPKQVQAIISAINNTWQLGVKLFDEEESRAIVEAAKNSLLIKRIFVFCGLKASGEFFWQSVQFKEAKVAGPDESITGDGIVFGRVVT